MSDLPSDLVPIQQGAKQLPPDLVPIQQQATEPQIAPGGRTTFFPNIVGKPFTGGVLPISRDPQGAYHPAVPEAIAAPFRGAVSMGERAFGIGEQGQNPLRPLTPDQLQTVMALSPASVARGTGQMIAGGAPLSAARQAAGQRLADFQAHDVTPSIPAIGQGRNVGLAANISRLAPFSPVTKGIQQNVQEVQNAAERAAMGFGQAETEAAAGNIAQNAMRKFATDKTQTTSDYGVYDRAMAGAGPQPVTRTLELFDKLVGDFPTNPQIRGILSHPMLSRLASALDKRTETIPAQTSGMLDQFGRPIVTRPARTVEVGGILTTPEIKTLRTQIGSMLETPQFGPDVPPRNQLRALYAALTNDMYAAAKTRGPAAVAALSRATAAFNQRMKLVDRLDDLTRADAPESVFYKLNAAATKGGGEDAKLLTMTKKVLSPEEWGDFGAAIIRRLGNQRPGQPRASREPDFSIGSFATNWRKLTPGAKDLIFGSGTQRQGLEQLARVAGDLQNVGRLANMPHSGEYVLLGDIFASVLTAVATGRLDIAVGAMAPVAGAWGVAKFLMNPKVADWVYRLPDLTRGLPAPQARAVALNELRVVLGGAKQDQMPPRDNQMPPPPSADRDLRASVAH